MTGLLRAGDGIKTISAELDLLILVILVDGMRECYVPISLYTIQGIDTWIKF